jgi:hypothetical protein
MFFIFDIYIYIYIWILFIPENGKPRPDLAVFNTVNRFTYPYVYSIQSFTAYSRGDALCADMQSMVCSIQHRYEGASSSVSDVDRYIISTKLLDSLSVFLCRRNVQMYTGSLLRKVCPHRLWRTLRHSVDGALPVK